MDIAVDFDDESMLATEKINDEGFDDVLTPEL